jgi:hypothetical protein
MSKRYVLTKVVYGPNSEVGRKPVGPDFTRPADLIAYVQLNHDEDIDRLEVSEFAESDIEEMTSYDDFLEYHESRTIDEFTELMDRFDHHMAEFQALVDMALKSLAQASEESLRRFNESCQEAIREMDK